VYERLRLGLWTMLRQGAVRNDLTATLPALLKGRLDTRRAVLVSDGIDPWVLSQEGHMDLLVREAIKLGLDPVTAIQMASLNPAEHYRMADHIGGIAPGRCADMVLLNDLSKVKVETVISNGRQVSSGGRLLAQVKPFSYPARYLASIKIRDKLSPDQFVINASGTSARVRVIQLVAESVTKELILELPVQEGRIPADPDRDILKAAVIDRHWNSGRLSLGFVKGFGSRLGAVASSVNFDENNLVVIGHRETDMVQAANWIRERQGGIVVVDRGRVLEALPLPLAGTCSLKPARHVGARLNGINQRLRAGGAKFERPLNAVVFLTFVTLPSIKMTDRGIVDVKARKFLPLLVDNP
jgi:adenine deaminase